MAWQASSDEGAEDSAIAPLCEEQGNRDSLSVQSESDNVEAGNSAKTPTGIENATQKDAEGKPPYEAETSKDGGVTAEPEGPEKDAESKPEVENEAAKEGAEKTTAVKGGE